MIKKLINSIFFYKRKKKAKILINVINKMLENQRLFSDGLCNWIYSLAYNDIINHYDYVIATRYIDLYSLQYFNMDLYSQEHLKKIRRYYYPFCWEIGDISPRIDWLNEQIKIQKQYL